MPHARNSLIVAALTLVSRVLGFLRDALMAAVLGAGPVADAFVAAFQLPNLARRLLAEGALNAAFVPVYAAARRGPGGPAAAARLTRDTLTVLVAGAAALVAVALVAMRWLIGLFAPGFADDAIQRDMATGFGRLAIGYVVFAALVAVFAARLNAEGKVAAAALLPILFNAVMAAALITAWLIGERETPQAGALLAIAVLIAGAAQAILIGSAAARLPERSLLRTQGFRFDPTLRAVVVRAAPALFVAGLPQLRLIAGLAVASATPGAVSWLWYAFRLFELPLGLVAAVVAAVLVPALSAARQDTDPQAPRRARSRAAEAALALALPATAGLALIAPDIVAVLFQRGAFTAEDTAATALALTALALGLPGAVAEKLLAADAFAHDDARSPVLAGLAGLFTAAAGAALAFPAFGLPGIAAAVALSFWITAAWLAIAAARAGRLALDADARRALPLILVATLAMTAIVATIDRALAGSPPVWSVVAAIGAGLVVYTGLIFATGAIDLTRLRRRDPLA
jgi:putative peptidoglycan lipid II flippase